MERLTRATQRHHITGAPRPVTKACADDHVPNVESLREYDGGEIVWTHAPKFVVEIQDDELCDAQTGQGNGLVRHSHQPFRRTQRIKNFPGMGFEGDHCDGLARLCNVTGSGHQGLMAQMHAVKIADSHDSA
jgi:hypothetical protein